MITRVVTDKATSLGFTDVSSLVAETLDSKYLLNIIFSYKGKSRRVYGAIPVAEFVLLEDSEVTPFVMQRAKDLLHAMCRVSGKDKEIPQTEEEYEQKAKWYQL